MSPSEIAYRIIYHPAVNLIIRSIGKFMNMYLGTKIVFPISGTTTLAGYDGKKILMETNETCFVGHTIFWNGIESYEYTTFFSKLSTKLDVFIDIGSNVGLYTVLAGVYNPNLKIYSFDPTEASVEFTNRNIKHNNLTNAQVFKMAMADKNGKMIFTEVLTKKYMYQKHHLAGSSSLIGDYISGNQYEVNTTSIDQFVIDQNLTSISAIKIDAERAEPLILEGGQKALAKYKPIIFCEIRPDMMDVINNLTLSLGYEMYHVQPNKMVKINDVSKLDYNWDHDFMFVHPSSDHLVKDLI